MRKFPLTRFLPLTQTAGCMGAAVSLMLVPTARAQSFLQLQPTFVPGATATPVGNTLLAELYPDAPAAVGIGDLPDAPSAVAREAVLPISSSADSFSDGAADPADPADVDQTLKKDVHHTFRDIASPTDLIVLAGQTASHQSARDKLLESARNSVSPFSIGGEVIAAGYSQLTNGSPNYGTGPGPFAQRFGAAVARGTSQRLFSDGIMSSVLHEDPRYYQMGGGHFFLKRIVYAGTRPLITRTDGGKSTPNLALLSGYLGASALTNVYYPPLNQGFSQTMQTFGGSLGGAALGYLTSEFLPDALEFLRLKKP